jgi:hypothetical protein
VPSERVIEISCLEVWREISSFIDGAVDPELRARLELHFKGCKHCAAIFDGASNLVGLVGDNQAFELPIGFTERLFQRLAPQIDEDKK